MFHSRIRISILILWVICVFAAPVRAQSETDVHPTAEPPEARPILVRAVVCEEIKDYQPVNPAVVFSVSLGEIFCFTAFSPVPKQTTIDFKWYRRDDLVTTRRVALYPPEWSVYSGIHLRAADIGPWRVEILGPGDEPLDVLRFSISR